MAFVEKTSHSAPNRCADGGEQGFEIGRSDDVHTRKSNSVSGVKVSPAKRGIGRRRIRHDRHALSPCAMPFGRIAQFTASIRSSCIFQAPCLLPAFEEVLCLKPVEAAEIDAEDRITAIGEHLVSRVGSHSASTGPRPAMPPENHFGSCVSGLAIVIPHRCRAQGEVGGR